MTKKEILQDNIRFIEQLIDECKAYGDKSAEDLLWNRIEELNEELSDIYED